ncbi:MAG: prolipoprotein diacylglyceryl transferase family protein, partial [Gemmatimonadota bacterium]
MNGCCHGKPTAVSWAVHFPVGGAVYQAHREAHLIAAEAPPLPVHPTQLYLAGLNLLTFFLIVLVLRPRKRIDGELFAWLLVFKGV